MADARPSRCGGTLTRLPGHGPLSRRFPTHFHPVSPAKPRGARLLARPAGPGEYPNSCEELRSMVGSLRRKTDRGARMTTVTISMPETLKAFVDEQVRTKGYGNVSEYFRELVRGAQAREADRRLETLLLEGLDSGEDIPVTREFWQDLKAEAARLLKERTAK